MRAPPTGLYHFRNGPRQGTRTGTPGKGTTRGAKLREKRKPNPELNKKESRHVHRHEGHEQDQTTMLMIASPTLSEELGVWDCLRSLNFIWILKLNSL